MALLMKRVTMQTIHGWLRCGLLGAVFGWCAGVQPAAAQYALLHSFSGGSDGANPHGSLTLYGTNFFGMTCYGGSGVGGIAFRMNSGICRNCTW